MAKKESFGDRLRVAVNQSGKERQVVAERLSISDSMLRKYQRGLSTPDIEMVRKMGKVLGVPPAWLAFGVGDATAGEKINDQ